MWILSVISIGLVLFGLWALLETGKRSDEDNERAFQKMVEEEELKNGNR